MDTQENIGERTEISISNKYEDTSASLQGTDRDILVWRATTGIDKTKLKAPWLRGNNVTKKQVIETIQEMNNYCFNEGLQLTLSHSSHGTRAISSQEADGYKEGWVINYRDTGKYEILWDNELKDLFDDFHEETKLVIIDDSCYSGGEAKGLQKHKSLFFKELNDSEDAELPKKYISRKKLKDNSSNFVMISACAENQTSADASFGGKFNGAHFHYFSKVYNKNLQIDQIFKKERKYLPSIRLSQTPLLWGNSKIYNSKFNY